MYKVYETLFLQPKFHNTYQPEDHFDCRVNSQIVKHNSGAGGTNYRTLWETDGPADEAVHDTHEQMDH
jgi:hypothetical protein